MKNGVMGVVGLVLLALAGVAQAQKAEEKTPTQESPKRTQEESVAAIKKLGGKVTLKPSFEVSLCPSGTEIIDAGLAKLKVALPKCRSGWR